MIQKLLLTHLQNNKKILEQIYKSTNVLNHTGNTGSVREGFIKNFSEDEDVLLGIFTFLLDLLEKWTINSDKHVMPIKKYIENEINSLEEW